MKKIIALALAIALLLGCTVAFAESTESHPTPNISSFAKLTTKDNGQYITITMDKPVDKLFVNWAEQKAVPEELAVEEINGVYTATALRIGHKYMPGVKGAGSAVNWTNVSYEYTVVASEALGMEKDAKGNDSWTETYKKAAEILNNLKKNYAGKYNDIEIALPEYVYAKDLKTGEDLTEKYTYTKNGVKYIDIKKLDAVAVNDGEIDLVFVQKVVDLTKPHPSTIKATKNDTAFITVQGDWIVEYNRGSLYSGCQIVAIRYNDGEY